MWFYAALVVALTLGYVRSRFEWVVVVGASMHPTFDSGDVLLVHKRAYRDMAPTRGDIVVARFRSERIVKRVVGLPGESVEVRSGALRVNGSSHTEPYSTKPGELTVKPGRLLPDRFALLGDNRSEPDSLLFYAVIPREHIIGRVVGSLRVHSHSRRQQAAPAVPPVSNHQLARHEP